MDKLFRAACEVHVYIMVIIINWVTNKNNSSPKCQCVV